MVYEGMVYGGMVYEGMVYGGMVYEGMVYGGMVYEGMGYGGMVNGGMVYSVFINGGNNDNTSCIMYNITVQNDKGNMYSIYDEYRMQVQEGEVGAFYLIDLEHEGDDGRRRQCGGRNGRRRSRTWRVSSMRHLILTRWSLRRHLCRSFGRFVSRHFRS
jgi:hypothetical protein